MKVVKTKIEKSKDTESQDYSLDYSDLGNYLNETFENTGSNRKYAVMIVVNQACYSGTMISHLEGDHRILIAAKNNEETYTDVGSVAAHWVFLYEGAVYKYGYNAATHNYVMSGNHMIEDLRSHPVFVVCNIILVEVIYL